MPLIVATSLAMFFASGYSRWATVGKQFLWQNRTSSSSLSHYMVAPTLLLLSALFVTFDDRPRLLSPRSWRCVRLAVAAVCIVGVITSFDAGDASVRGSPTWSEAIH